MNMRGGISIPRRKLIELCIVIPIALAALLYGGGFIAQFIYNYGEWQAAGGQFGTAPQLPDANFLFASSLCSAGPLGYMVLASASVGWPR